MELLATTYTEEFITYLKEKRYICLYIFAGYSLAPILFRGYIQQKEASLTEALSQLSDQKIFISSLGAEYELLAKEHIQNAQTIQQRKEHLARLLNK